MSNTENQFVWFLTAEECAKEAAPVFEQQKWHWLGRGIPSEAEVIERLRRLEQIAMQDNRDYCESGRLCFSKDRFGYQQPLGILSNSVWERREP